jgi:hypothetical protein
MDPALQLIIDQSSKLDMSDIKGKIKNDISGIHDKISADISDNRADISAINDGQAKFKERIMDTLHKQLKGVTAMVQQETLKLREEVNSELQITRRDILEATRRDLQAAHRELEMRLVAV